MAEAFKNWLNPKVVEGLASHFEKHYSSFNMKGFITDTTEDFDSLELKQRSVRITEMMIKYLPDDYKEAGEIIRNSLPPYQEDKISLGTVDDDGVAGWAVMSLTYFVALQGNNDFDYSMGLLKELTMRETAEFDIRHFLISEPEKTLAVLETWATDSSQHVRRLVSEGSRPRLPWGMRLPQFIKNPAPVILLLEKLKDDESEYVRRSVANNLNDIAKDHPDLVADIAEAWMKGASKDRIKLIKHACRTLVKNGHKKTLSVLGYNNPEIKQSSITIATPEVIFGETLQFSVSLNSASKHDQPVMIDYIIHHQKANGSTSPKVFKLRVTSLLSNKPLQITKIHTMKKITTRKYYAGLHRLEVVVNGVSIGQKGFQLTMDCEI